MTKKISEIYGKPIYSEEGELLGTVSDLIIDTKEGKSVRIVTEELNRVSKTELQEIIKEKSIRYDRVKSIGDIVLLGRSSSVISEPKEEKKKNEDQNSFSSFLED